MKNSAKNTIWRIIGIIFFLLAVVFGVLLFLNLRGCEGDVLKYKNPSVTKETDTLPNGETSADGSGSDTDTNPSVSPEPEVPIATGELPSEVIAGNTVDFDSMEDINPDIHAWIKIPGTNVDYPVLRHESEPLYYERRSYTGEYSISGCIFTQLYNNKDFSDRNTLVYGHYMMDGTFFGTLHNYKDPDFFEANRYIYVTIPGHILVYDIFAAYEYDNRHILGSFDFSDDEEYEKYLESCLNPSTMIRNVREGVELTVDDRLITLSTCTSYTDTSRRYLVQGVLVADVETE